MDCLAKVASIIVFLIIVHHDSHCYFISNPSEIETQLNVENTKRDVGPFGEKQVAPFNDILGIASSNVPAYSNGNDTFISGEKNSLHKVFMGLKWQCVEFARRWLFLRKGCIFEDVDSADDIWHRVNKIKRVIDGRHFPLKAYQNGSPQKPKNESFIIYKKSSPDLPYGHIAVIVDVLPGFIRVAEQNYYFHYWTENYARQIPLIFENGSYYIKDDYQIYGWMKVESKKRLQPLNNFTITKLLVEPKDSVTSKVPSQATGRQHFQLSHELFIVLSLSLYLF